MIKWTTITFPAASMGEVNPLADIYNIEYIHAGYEVTENITEEEKNRIGKGMINSILPYTIQDNFSRDRKPREFKAVVLENQYLKATFLPELGARLWSLFDKEHCKELLYVNPVFQPANLAIRNAWFAGGVEFNVGIKGHNMLTCDDYFARIARTSDGQEVLQLYEYERVRGLTFGINAYLPDNSKVLYLQDTVENPSDEATYNYWWSNVAVPDTKGTRIIVPTNRSFKSTYDDGHYILDKVEIPYENGVDSSYPINLPRSLDYFYEIPEQSDQKWICAIPEDGVGFTAVSTKNMKGKKLFVWGQGAGGKNWGNWLSADNGGYVEIQSGLEYTQLEHVLMPANTTWRWAEGYTYVDCDVDKAFSSDWDEAIGEVNRSLSKTFGTDNFDEALRSVVPTDFAEYEILHYGSGYAYAEQKMRGKRLTDIYEFYAESCSERQVPWLELVDSGVLREVDVSARPVSYVVGKGWQNLLERSVSTPDGNNWFARYHLGITRYHLGDFEGAKREFEASAQLKPNAWAYRNLAMIARHEKQYPLAVDYIEKAIELEKSLVNIYIDYMRILMDAEMFEKAEKEYLNFPELAKNRARIRLQYAVAMMKNGKYEKATEIINADFVMEDIREGEISISRLWEDLYTSIVKSQMPDADDKTVEEVRKKSYPLPQKLDFRMH